MAEQHFQLELLDVEKFIKVNEIQEITNPIFFIRDGIPTTDGLLSNEIFGITKEDRANTFAYIDLYETFMNPLCYKIWIKLDRKVRDIVHGTKKFIINAKGEFEEDEENGKNGIKFLKDNINFIKFKTTDSNKRDRNIQFMYDNKDKMFIKKMLVVPAYYRDVNTNNGGNVGVGDINNFYKTLLVAIRSLKESADYGLTLSNSTRGRIQETLLEIYNWFGDEPNLSKKFGIIRRANVSKTTDYASRLVMSAPNLRVERVEDLLVDMDHAAVPLASVCTNFFPYVMFHVRRFFENEFAGEGLYPTIDKNGKLISIHVKDYQINFSDEVIKKEIERFLYGYSNRLIPIQVPNEEGKEVYMRFKGRNLTPEQYVKKEPGNSIILDRDLTWCDVFFMAAVEASKDKTILITRYPINN